MPVFGIALLAHMLQGCNMRGSHLDMSRETLPMKKVTLENFDSFRSVEGNWTIAGDITSNRGEEHDLGHSEGTGTLVNIPAKEHKSHLFTKWTHGDLELEMDFLLPKGSNSGIYLMGRYEVQLYDSWGVDNPAFSDAGGIYQRWDENKPEAERGSGGTPPRLNASKAPGLWQHVKILFKAPAFNEQDEKISNAEFEEVWLNGVLVQENVEVSGPTRAAPVDNEQAEGPLMIQGDHGPVAIRNISYKKYDKKEIRLENLAYDYFAESLDQFPDFDTLDAAESGTADSLSGSIINKDDRYALRYSGTLQSPNSGTYLFKLLNAGKVRMLIDGNVIFDQDRFYRMHETASATVDLEKGQHDFTLEYIDHHNNWYSGLALFTEGPRLRYQKLHASSSAPGGDRPLPELMVEVKDRTKILRSFAMHGDTKRTHVVNVGAANRINYNYDMGQGALLQAWNGPFVNTNEMWINRGEPQIAKPGGAVVSFDGKPLGMRLSNNTTAWPDSISWDQLSVEGYTIGEDGMPVFHYELDGIRVEDRFEGYARDRRLVRTVHLSADKAQDNFWMHLASGEEINGNGSGEYVIDDRAYYLEIIDRGESNPQIVETEAGRDLRVQMLTDSQADSIKYAIIW